MKKKKPNAMVGSVLCLIIGVLIIMGGFFFSQRARESASWPTVKGTIVTAESSVGLDNRDRIEYEYSVADQIYKGRRMRYGLHTPPNRFMYPLGKNVTVSYDPDKPSRCVLHPGPGKASGGIMLFGLVFGAFGVPGMLKVMLNKKHQ